MKKLFSVGAIVAGFFLANLANHAFDYITPHYNLATAKAETVEIVADGGHGSGVLIGPDTILTARHVAVAVADKDHAVRVKLADGTEVFGHVVSVGAPETENRDDDEATIKLDKPVPGPYAHIACKPLAVGDRLHSLGYPGPLGISVTEGSVASDVPYKSVLTPTDLTIFPGMSGGPVFNDEGELVGLNIAVMLVPINFSASLSGISLIYPVSLLCTNA